MKAWGIISVNSRDRVKRGSEGYVTLCCRACSMRSEAWIQCLR